MAERKRATRTKKREKKNVPVGHVHIQSTFNNTIVTITDPTGNTVSWGSSGLVGIKGSRKSTPYAASQTAEGAARRAMEHGIRSLQTAGLEVTAITDVTPIPHNGCRPPKRRRV